MSSGKIIKINKVTSMEFDVKLRNVITGEHFYDGIVVRQVLDGIKTEIRVGPTTLEAIYKEYKRKIFNDEMKEIIDSSSPKEET